MLTICFECSSKCSKNDGMPFGQEGNGIALSFGCLQAMSERSECALISWQLDDLVYPFTSVVHRYLNDGMLLLYCQPRLFGSFISHV